jgi:hypothetical protein
VLDPRSRRVGRIGIRIDELVAGILEDVVLPAIAVDVLEQRELAADAIGDGVDIPATSFPFGFTYSTVGCVNNELITSGQPSPVKSYANCTPLKY